MKAECVVCGREFEKVKNKKTCGTECSYENRRTRHIKYSRAYRKNRPEKVRKLQRETMRRLRAADPEKFRSYLRQYRTANPDKFREYHYRRKAPALLGLNPIQYAALKIMDRFTQTQEGTDA